jgi:hypothetical protein
MAYITSMKQIMLINLVGFNTCHGYGYVQMLTSYSVLEHKLYFLKGKSDFYDRSEAF